MIFFKDYPGSHEVIAIFGKFGILKSSMEELMRLAKDLGTKGVAEKFTNLLVNSLIPISHGIHLLKRRLVGWNGDISNVIDGS